MDNQAREFFAAEIDRLADRLFGTALRLTRNREDAEDLVAETVVKAWFKCADVRDPRCFEGWIQRILSNTFMSEWRHRRASPIVALETNDDDTDDGDPFSLFEKLHQPFLLWWSNPEERVVTKLLKEDIERALDALPDVFRVAVVLVDVQGYSYAEAAELLEVPVGTVRSRLARARSALQRSLWQHACDAGFANADLGRVEPQELERKTRG
ncbi:MAG TPA: sigma-70 family RNA polymerase sigma factor [Burkholderiaceae bacterium]|nr:sigma-70 family RNA polymerase sigma factor [Burkholderiaceae bacterium]